MIFSAESKLCSCKTVEMYHYSMPEVHVCSRLTDENEQLLRKLKKIKRKNNALEEELKDINEKLKFENFVKENTLRVSVGTQTEVSKPLVIRATKQPLKQKDDQQKQIDGLLKMNKNIMKKHQKELKYNGKHLETIAALNIRVHELESQLSDTRQKLDHLENLRRTPSSQGRRRTPASRRRKRSPMPLDDSLDLKTEVSHLRQERDKLVQERKMLKKELGALDEDFFEEIEDLKFALQQSAKLNKEYQRTLEKLSQQFGFPVPRVKCQNSGKRGKLK